MVYLLILVAVPLVGESVAYCVHVLLHSEKIPLLSRAHMAHHLKHYSPKVGFRSTTYRRPRTYRVSPMAKLGLAGIEILIPGVMLNGLILGGMLSFGATTGQVVTFGLAANAWVWFSFNYMHNGIHVRRFWMERHPLFRSWFQYIRRQHDIHHCQFTDNGKLRTNFGMTMFFMDRIFRTFTSKGVSFNEKGFQAALRRYKPVL